MSQRYLSALFDHSENIGRSKDMDFLKKKKIKTSLRAKPSGLIKLFGSHDFYYSSLKESKIREEKKTDTILLM